MPSTFQKLEQQLFRQINGVVEPAVRKGLGSPRFTPASLIVLETTGFKSGEVRRTPLWSLKLGRYRLVSTARGNRSFWVKNLRKNPENSYFLAGKRRPTRALVVESGAATADDESLSPAIRRIVNFLSDNAREGWAFALLMPKRN